MSQRKQRRDEVWPKRSIDTSNTADVQGVGGDRLNSGRGWRRRSLFSSERLDLILSNLRRNLGKSVDDDRCKPISHDLTDGSGDQRTHLRRLQKQQQQRGADDAGSNRQTSRRYESTRTGGAVESGDPATTKSATESTSRHDDESSRAARHRDSADLDSAAVTGGSTSDVRRIEKSLSFRAEARRPSDNEADRSATSRVFRSLSRRRQRTDERQRRHDQSSAITVAPASRARNTGVSGRDASTDDVFRDEASRRSRSLGPRGRSSCADGLKTQRNTDVAQQVNCSSAGWSSIRHPTSGGQQFLSGDSERPWPASINWYVDLSNVAGTEYRPSQVSVDRSRQHRGDCRAGSKAGADKLEPGPCRTTSWENASGRRGRAAARMTSEQSATRLGVGTKTTNAVALTSALDDLDEKFTQLRRSLSLRHVAASSPKTNRASELRRSSNRRSEDPVFHGPSDSKCRRSMMATRPRNCEMSIHARGAVQPVQPTRTRSLSLSEQYRTLIGGDWFDSFPTSSSAVDRQKPTKVRDPHKPLALSRALKPDFVIYV